MASYKKINPTLKSYTDTGFGVSPDTQGGRFINKDGSYNVVKRGLPFYERISFFYKILTMPVWKFLLVLATFFLSVNIVFTAVYLAMNKSEFDGVIPGNF